MNEFVLQPNLYGTGRSSELLHVLDELWPRTPRGDSTFYIVSGFGSFNGGVSFFERFRVHIENGGHVRAVFGSSRNTNVTSRQLVDSLIDCGVDVHLINRRYMMHSKLYGVRTAAGEQELVISSGNFTAPGISRNIESVLALDDVTVDSMSFEWDALFEGLLSPTLEIFHANSASADDPRWALLYDERSRGSRKPAPEEQDDVLESLIMTLGPADTARIMAKPGTRAYRGSQYFWLSKDAYAFFPALTIRSRTDRKATYSCLIDLTYDDLDATAESRVTLEAENNLDFRLGTGRLRGSGLAQPGDIAVLSRRGDTSYDLKIVSQGTSEFFALSPYATTHIGQLEKRYGFAPNAIVDPILGRRD